MKRLVLALTLCLWACGAQLFAQNFTYCAYVTQKPVLFPYTQFYSEIYNYDTTDDSFRVIKDDSQLAPTWSCQFCVGYTCYPPFVDSVDVLMPASSMDSVLVDIFPDSSAHDGEVTMTVEPLHHPELAMVISFYVFFNANGFAYTAANNEQQGTPNQVASFRSDIFNTTDLDLNLVVQMDTLLLPTTWESNFWVGTNYYPPTVTSATVTLPPLSSDTVQVDITPSTTPDDGWVTMSVYPEYQPELAVSINFHVYLPTAVCENPAIPISHELLSTYPNPFNPNLTIAVTLERPELVTLDVWDLRGQKIAEVFAGNLATGQHEFTWQAGQMGSGIYLARLNANGESTTRKVVLLK